MMWHTQEPKQGIWMAMLFERFQLLLLPPPSGISHLLRWCPPVACQHCHSLPANGLISQLRTRACSSIGEHCGTVWGCGKELRMAYCPSMGRHSLWCSFSGCSYISSPDFCVAFIVSSNYISSMESIFIPPECVQRKWQSPKKLLLGCTLSARLGKHGGALSECLSYENQRAQPYLLDA